MTRNGGALRHWARVDAAREKREAMLSRNRLIERADPQAHVEMWEVVEGLARIIGWDRAYARVCADLAVPSNGEDSGEKR
jgi:hypothetical protein